MTALHRNIPDKVPKYCDYGTFAPELMAKFHAAVGSITPEDYFDYDIRSLSPAPAQKTDAIARYVPEKLAPGEYVEWAPGNVCRYGAHKNISVVTHYALEDAETAEDILRYPMDDPLPRMEQLPEEIEALHKRGYAVIGPCGSLFEWVWGVRGLDTYLMDLLCEEEIAETLLERRCGIMCRMAQKTARSGADILRTGDDFGTEKGMMVDPALWRRFFKPRLRQVIAAAKEVNPDILAFYHSDGNIYPIVEDLIEIGVDILNPVQPECMDPALLKTLYGDRLSFWGGIGTQTTMPFGTPEEIEEVVKLRMATIGKGGGYVIAPTHLLQDEVPLENVFALYRAIEQYGSYE